MLIFNEKEHSYVNSATNRPYISVSKLLSLYKEPFNKEFFAQRAALKEGVSKQEIINRWEKTNKDACDKGQSVHEIVENYIKHDEVGEKDTDLIESLKRVFDKKAYKRVLSEEIVYNDEYELAGTSDVICDVNDDFFDVYDFKTNKKFQFFNPYGKYLKTPLNNLQQCQYNDYSIQLSLYAYMYGSLTNRKVRKINILYHDGKQFHTYPTPYLFWEISALLKHYKMNYGQNASK